MPSRWARQPMLKSKVLGLYCQMGQAADYRERYKDVVEGNIIVG
jgi:hypothetical protein